MLAVIVALSSCTKDFEEMNKPYNQPSTASVADLFNSTVSSAQISYQEQATYHSFIYQVTQQSSQYASSGYRMENASNEMWQSYYAMLANSRLIDTMIAVNANKANMTNILAMNKTLRAFRTVKMTENFGNIPYFKAGYAIYGDAFYKPAYDKQADIYLSVMNDLKWAVDNFSSSASQVSLGGSETFLNNDIAMWVKFANSLRLRCAVTMYDKNTTVASSHITEALTKPLLAEGDNVGLWPAKIAGLVFDMHAWSFSANQYIRMGTSMWRYMSNNDAKDGSGIFDPRCKIFFEPNNAGEWAAYPQNPTLTTKSEGGDPYNDSRDNNWPTKGAGCVYSPVNYYFKDRTYIPELMMTAAMVNLLKAEIYARGMGVSKNLTTARAEYEKGITTSVNFWTNIAINCPKWVVNKPASLPSSAQLTTLLSNPKVVFDPSDEAGSLKKIYAQMWIDGFRQPWDIWTLKRRTGSLPMDSDNAAYYDKNYSIYHRYTYPTSEQDYNLANWRTATGDNDSFSTKTWLEKQDFSQ
ncbi:hypothetical protein FGO68_gene11070 [Halteria grandinella]|uniref:SusD/RagB family nutrient-binding outer membrane lipoprotein n=1 Tax=Halteria grandinella TaxID=5974 RepID=A0A8J8NB76_HALGN|nr:hypothetical protein FGO68_gene11070 [Halteria grandinella]